MVLVVLAASHWITPRLHPAELDGDSYLAGAEGLGTGQGYRMVSAIGAPPLSTYPPLHPALASWVWWLNPDYPSNLGLLHGWMQALAAAALLLIHLEWVRRGMPAWLSALLCAARGTSGSGGRGLDSPERDGARYRGDRWVTWLSRPVSCWRTPAPGRRRRRSDPAVPAGPAGSFAQSPFSGGCGRAKSPPPDRLGDANPSGQHPGPGASGGICSLAVSMRLKAGTGSRGDAETRRRDTWTGG